MTKIYYGPNGNHSDDYMLVPAPIISITTEFSYANDTIIGYIYKLNLDGYCSNFKRSSTEDDSATNPDYYGKNIQKVLGGMEIIRKILSRNGSNFEVQKEDNTTVIKAKGGTLRSLNFDETDNAWSVYSKYTAEIEFNELEFMGESVSCGLADFDAASKSPNLVDIDKHKIKSFSDGWNFSIVDQSFDYVRDIDTNSNLAIHNMVINATYNIDVTGKNYYIDDELIPAHEQARLFAQKRLYDRVSQLVVGNQSNILKVTTNADHNPCGSNTLNTIHENGPGILGNISYLPHNETVSCEISESNGSFSANYSCILKSKAIGMTYSAPSVIHTIEKSRTRNRTGNKNDYTISITGNIEGLVLGGLIYSAGNFSLPSSGSFILKSNDNTNKFGSASNFYNTIGSEQDLKDSLKEVLGITYDELNITTNNNNDCPSNPLPPTPKPSSFNLTKNYIEGTISYNAEYSTNSACNRDGESIQKISITTDNPVPVIAQFTVPNGDPPRTVLNEQTAGTIIQDLKTVTAKKINITIEGKKNRVCCNTAQGLLDNFVCQEITLPPGISLPNPEKFILTQKNKTENKIEGTYTINLSYICDPGCSLI